MTFYDLDTVFTFGKYKGETLREVFERDPAYVDYCLVNVDEFLVVEPLRSRCLHRRWRCFRR